MPARGEGSPNARLMIVGEAWGQNEETHGAPFVGASGQELNKILHEVGLTRNECYLTNVVNARPPFNDIEKWVTAKRKDITSDMVKWRDRYVKPIAREGINSLLEEIHLVKPNVIVALGNVAMWALTGASGIFKWRGSQLNCALGRELYPPGLLGPTDAPWSGKLIPTLHPAYLLRDYGMRPTAMLDWKRVLKEIHTAEYSNLPQWNFIVRPSLQVVLSILADLYNKVERGELEWLDFDLETRAGHIACAGISWSRTDAVCIPFMCVEDKNGYWLVEEEAQVVWLLYKLLTHPRVKVRGQNLLYDCQYTYRHWHFVPRVVQDTMIAHHSTFCGLQKSLAFQASMYCDHYVYWKDDGKTWTHDVSEEQLWRYNCVDCVRTREAGEVEAQNIEKLGLQSVDAFQQKFFWPVLQCMQRGIAVDKKVRQKFATELLEEMEKREAFFQRVLGHPLNPKSPKQMAELFYEDLKQQKNFSRPKKGMPATLTCDDEALQKIALREPILRPLIKAIGEYRSLGVFLSTFVLAPLDIDGRMRTSYNICGTETFRFSSSENAFGSGCVPPDAEVLTRTGWQRIDRVYSGQELLQYDPKTKELSYAQAEPHAQDFDGEMLAFSGEQVNQLLTPGHKFPLLGKYVDSFSSVHAAQAAARSNDATPLGGNYSEGFFYVTAPRLLVAALADGSYEEGRVRISVKKARKQERLLSLLEQSGIEYSTSTAREGYLRVSFRRPADWPEEKAWGAWVLLVAAEDCEAMLDEIPYWDGGAGYGRPHFFTASREQAEWVATLAHLYGRSATITGGDGPQSEAAYGTWKVFCVNMKARDYARFGTKHWKPQPYKGTVHCVTVPTGFFLMRYEGFIAVTGNTNLQNIPKGGDDDEGGLSLPNVRKIFVPDPGFTIFDTDLSKADLRIVTWESNEPEMKAMLKEGRDPYVEIAREFYKDPSIKKTREDGSENPKYRTFKSFAHGTHYLGTPYGLAGRLGLSVHQADKTQKWYFQRFPRIQAWQKEFCEALKSRRYVENIFGYRRYYFDRVDEATCREAIAWLPQSTVALYINRIWMNLYEKYPHIWVLLQVHDSLVGQFPTWKKQECLKQLHDAGQIVLPYDDPLIIPVGVKTSETSWGDC